MNIVYFSNGIFGLDPLITLHKSNHKIQAVITNIDKPSGRNKTLKQTPIAKYAIQNNLNLIKIDNLNEQNFINKLNLLKSDIFIVISYRILPKSIFNMPKYGSINIHASYLPEYPGASPIQRSIINGEDHLGLTSFILNDKIDKGNIVYQKKININDKITYGDAHDMLTTEASSLLVKTIDDIINTKPFKQEGDIIEYAHKINKNEYKISLNNNCIKIHNYFRGLTPPGPYLLLDSRRVKLYNTYYDLNENDTMQIGQFFVKNNNIYIKCKAGFITASTLQFEGKKSITAIDFKNMNLKDNIIFE
tara:strand:- start:8766 stop:9680 length:915 start_codon:yes stop_codon:yes gene_type:complete